MTEPRIIVPAACTVCGDPTVIRLPVDWRAQVEAGSAIPIAGCGNPWHYEPDDGPLPPGPAARLFMSPDQIDNALANLRGPVTRSESIVMAAAGAAASSMRTGRPIVQGQPHSMQGQPHPIPCGETP